MPAREGLQDGCAGLHDSDGEHIRRVYISVISISSSYNIKKRIDLTGIDRTGCNSRTLMTHVPARRRSVVLAVDVCVHLVLPFVVVERQRVSG
ncbi:MAG TPA: hypothetical protein VG871_13355 [Vicinamibacterales bacterium]|nr:hypothetical protein [Vicinamibacterales bacterium]